MLFKPADNAIFEGLYAAHLQRWLRHYPRSQFKVYFYEELFHSRSSMSGMSLANNAFCKHGVMASVQLACRTCLLSWVLSRWQQRSLTR